MSWVRSDDNEPNHPKIFRAGIAAYGFFQAAKCYCSRNLTDGFIPVQDLPLISPSVPSKQAMSLATKLAECGLFEKKDEGWYVHDYLDYNPSREQVLARRDERAAAGKLGGLAKAKAHVKRRANQQLGVIHPTGSAPTRPDPTQPKDEQREALSPAGTLTADLLIDLFNELTPDETPSVETRSPERMSKADRYLKTFPEEQFWHQTFTQFHRSAFLRGLAPKKPGHESFVPDFDWLLSKGRDGTENVVKVHDGRYA
jgi:hypothetical protein